MKIKTLAVIGLLALAPVHSTELNAATNTTVKVAKDESGKVDYKNFYKNGKRVKYEDWNKGKKVKVTNYKNGKVTSKTYYKNGVKTKRDKWSNGKVVQRTLYKNGYVTSKNFYNSHGIVAKEEWSKGKIISKKMWISLDNLDYHFTTTGNKRVTSVRNESGKLMYTETRVGKSNASNASVSCNKYSSAVKTSCEIAGTSPLDTAYVYAESEYDEIKSN